MLVPRDGVVVEWQSIMHWGVGSIPTTGDMKIFVHKNFHLSGAGRHDDMEAEHHGPKITGLRAKGSNGIYTSRPSFSFKSDLI